MAEKGMMLTKGRPSIALPLILDLSLFYKGFLDLWLFYDTLIYHFLAFVTLSVQSRFTYDFFHKIPF